MDSKTLLAEFNKNLKELRQIIDVLGNDCKKYYANIQNSDDQLHRRAYVRAVFALIEGITHRMKEAAKYLGILQGVLSSNDIVILDGKSLDINENGDIKTKTSYPRFQNNLKFAFKILSKASGSDFVLSVGGVGWQYLNQANAVRNRLMHPKEAAELQVTDDEVQAAKKALDWFLYSHAICSYYMEKAIKIKSGISPENLTEVDARILKFEVELKKRGN